MVPLCNWKQDSLIYPYKVFLFPLCSCQTVRMETIQIKDFCISNNSHIIIFEIIVFKMVHRVTSLNGKALKLVDQFIYFGSNISSAESSVNIHISKAWTDIDRLMTIQKSDLSEKIRILPSYSSVGSIWTLLKCLKKKLDWNYTRMLHAI